MYEGYKPFSFKEVYVKFTEVEETALNCEVMNVNDLKIVKEYIGIFLIFLLLHFHTLVILNQFVLYINIHHVLIEIISRSIEERESICNSIEPEVKNLDFRKEEMNLEWCVCIFLSLSIFLFNIFTSSLYISLCSFLYINILHWYRYSYYHNTLLSWRGMLVDELKKLKVRIPVLEKRKEEVIKENENTALEKKNNASQKRSLSLLLLYLYLSSNSIYIYMIITKGRK